MLDANYEIATRFAKRGLSGVFTSAETKQLEDAWAFSITTSRGFCYVSEPTPFMKKVLEKVFGPLDYDIPYV